MMEAEQNQHAFIVGFSSFVAGESPPLTASSPLSVLGRDRLVRTQERRNNSVWNSLRFNKQSFRWIDRRTSASFRISVIVWR
jgi:hypothetical protein